MHVAYMCLITSVGIKKQNKTKNNMACAARASSRTIAGQEASWYLHKDRVHLCADRGNYPVLIPLSKPLARFVLTDFGDLRARAVITHGAAQSRLGDQTFGAAEEPAGGVRRQVGKYAQAGEKKKKTSKILKSVLNHFYCIIIYRVW